MEDGIETLTLGERTFQFELCRKATLLGETEIEQWWMPHGSVYQDRKRNAANFEPLIEAFWAICRENGTDGDRDDQQVYLLAKLLPMARSNAARKVVLDSAIDRWSTKKAEKAELVEELDSLLIANSGKRLGESDFRHATGEAIGPPFWDESMSDLYLQMQSELFDPAHEVFERNRRAPFEITSQQWQHWYQAIGRRSTVDERKVVLDVLSYESRAALNQCYSEVWERLIPELAIKHDLSPTAQAFHRFWHCLHIWDAVETDEARFDLFHGHVFALHPAAGIFIQTPTGGRLIEAYLLDSDSRNKWQELLAGLDIAVWHYKQRHEQQTESRKKQPQSIESKTLDQLANED